MAIQTPVDEAVRQEAEWLAAGSALHHRLLEVAAINPRNPWLQLDLFKIDVEEQKTYITGKGYERHRAFTHGREDPYVLHNPAEWYLMKLSHTPRKTI